MDYLFLISILTTALVLALLALVRQVRLQRALRRLLSRFLNQRRISDAYLDPNTDVARDDPDGLRQGGTTLKVAATTSRTTPATSSRKR